MRAASVLLALATLTAACSDEKSVVVVSVHSRAGAVPGVAQLRVRATNNGQANEYSQELLYPENPRSKDALLELKDDKSDAKPVTFSLSFRSMFKGAVTFDVEALDTEKNVLASGESLPQQLNVGQVTYADVWVSPACDPMQPVASCGQGKNCVLMCDSRDQTRTVCMASGAQKTGEICNDLSECAQGSECFKFTCSGTPIKTCRKLCASDADCETGATCLSSTPCSASPSRALICSRPCDPTGDALAGCGETGLRCFIYAGEITDCACNPSTRTGGIGQTCTADDGCLPGLTCVDSNGQKSCRPLCKLELGVAACPSGTTCRQLNSPVYKVYGACL